MPASPNRDSDHDDISLCVVAQGGSMMTKRVTVKVLLIRLEAVEAKVAAIEAELQEMSRFVPDYLKIQTLKEADRKRSELS